MARGSGEVHPDRTTAAAAVRWQEFVVTTADGFPLAVRRLTPPDPVDRIVLASATGVPQGFYRRFAEYAAARGYDVVTFDYRGIAGSAPSRLAGFRMDYRDWGRLDLAAVIGRVTADGGDVLLVGHSFGGLALGLLPQPGLVRAAHFFGSGSGWRGWMSRWERARVSLLLNVVGPLTARAFGYVPGRRLGMGEDLPTDVFRQWRRWCGYPGFWFEDPAVAEEMTAAFDRVRTPIVAATSVDDPWIVPVARDRFMAHYRRADVVRVDLDPQDYGLRALGHLGYFRDGAQPLWDEVLDRFDALRA